MRRFVFGLFLAVSLSAAARAQTVRGTIVVEATGLPVSSVLVTLVGADGAEIPPGVRSDTLGAFTIHAARPGRYRVKATRIGFGPLTSDQVSLGPGELVVLRLRMTTVAQQLVPVRVVERRPLSLSELMSSAGFDLRNNKGVGRFLDTARLSTYGLNGAGEVLRSTLRPALEFTDGVDGTFLWMRTPRDARTGLPGQCYPEIYLDGTLLSSPEDSGTMGRREHAFAMLEGYPANELYGIEVYKGSEIPPPSVGGLFGERNLAIKPCGVVAVWTKKGRKLAGNAARGPGLSGIQVIRGVVVDFDTDKPIAGVSITLVSETGTRFTDDVHTDSLGEFTLRTRRVGALRLEAGDVGRGPKTTPTFQVAPEELIIVKFFVSGTTPVMAPLGIRTRALPQTWAVTDPASFAYRRERGIVGAFFGAEEIQRRGVTTLAELINGVDGVTITGTPPADTIEMRNTVLRSGRFCPPAFFVNGSRVIAGVDSVVKSLRVDRVFGVEVYTVPSLVPSVHAHEIDDCGMIGIWMRDR